MLVPGCRVLGTAVSLTEALCWHDLHPICLGPAGQGPTSLFVLKTFPPLLLPSPFQRNLYCLSLESIEEGWRETLLSLKMFLLNILILPRHQSLYFPFSPYTSFPEADSREQPRCLNLSWGRGWRWGVKDRRELLGAQKWVIISKKSPAALELLVLRPAPTC